MISEVTASLFIVSSLELRLLDFLNVFSSIQEPRDGTKTALLSHHCRTFGFDAGESCLQDVGSLGNDGDSKRGTKLKLGKSLEIYGGVYHPSCNLRLLTLKRCT